MKLLLKDADGQSVCVSVLQNDTFGDLKARIAENDGIDIDIQEFSLAGQVIQNHYNVFQYFHLNPEQSTDLSLVKNEWTCCALNCSSSFTNTPKKSYFMLPLDQEKRSDWLKAVNREDLLEKTPNDLLENFVICEDHFADELEDLQINFQDENKTKQHHLCRLCAETYLKEEMSSIFEITDKITKCLPLTVKANDGLSKLVCLHCIEKLNSCISFIELCVEAEKKQLKTNREVQKGIEKPNCLICLKRGNKTSFLSTPEFFEALEKHNEVCVGEENKNSYLQESLQESSENKEEEEENENVIEIYCTACEKNVLMADYVNGKCHKTSIYLCFFCQFVFSTSAKLRDHLREHFFNEVEEAKNEKSIIMWKCRKCDVEFSEMNSFLEHSKGHIAAANSNCLNKDQKKDEEEEDENLMNEDERLKSSKLFKCDICPKTFRCKDRMEFHKNFHLKGSNAGQCEKCMKEFPTELRLYRHMLYNHLDPKLFTCEHCGKTFRNKSSLTYHSRSHTSFEAMRPFSCDICMKRFSRKNILRDHMMNRHNASVNQNCMHCRLCNEMYPDRSSISRHIKVHHPDKVDHIGNYFEVKEVNRLFNCEFCDRCYSLPSILIEHRLVHNKPPPRHECKFCQEEFPNSFKLKLHLDLHAPAEYKNDFQVPIFYMCKFCEKCYRHYETYRSHCDTHLGETPYQCRFCSKSFSRLEEIVKHRLSEHPPESDLLQNHLKPFKCSHCSKSFISASTLTKHIRTHTGEKPFPCKICNKSFTQTSGLYTHLKVHSSDRPYQCDLCDSSFKIIGDYKLHVRKHSGLRPYKCDNCSKSFMTQRAITQHRKIHSDEKPFVCDVCHESFRRLHTLKTHKLRHSDKN